MLLDIRTILLLMTAAWALAAAVLFFLWRQDRSNRVYLAWSGSFALGTSGLAMVGLRGQIDAFLSIDIANALILAGAGLLWSGVRRFDGRDAASATVLMPTVVWLLLLRIPAIHGSTPTRYVLMSALTTFICLGVAYELRRKHDEWMGSRRALTFLAAILGIVFLLRGVLSAFLPVPGTFDEPTGLWFGLISTTPLLALVAGVMFGVGFVRERRERELSQLATLDELTGTLNRRGFFDSAARQMAAARRGRLEVALLLFDLDRFKRINDEFGHGAGDLVLRVFANVAMSELRRDDVFGRIGGEEFAALLTGADEAQAGLVAERIRQALNDKAIIYGESRLSPTVSTGVVSRAAGQADLASLIATADAALYRAKDSGRDRVCNTIQLAS